MTARRTGPLTLAALAALSIAALTACGTDHPLAPTAAPVVPAAATGSPGVAAGAPSGAEAGVVDSGSAGAAARPGAGSGGAARPGAGSGSGIPRPGTTGDGAGGAAPSTPAPAIAGFRVVSQPTCPVQGTPDAPFSSPGTPVTIAWSVTGADGAAIAVDNPGLYGAYGTSYPAKGQLELPFGCSGSGTTTHTFTVWPEGDRGTSKTITVSARSGG